MSDEHRKADRTTRPPRPNQKLLTYKQAHIEFGIPPTSTRDLVTRGYLPVVRLGNSRRDWLRRTDIERLIDQSTEKVGA